MLIFYKKTYKCILLTFLIQRKVRMLGLQEIEEMTSELIPLLRGIYAGKIPSTRHDVCSKIRIKFFRLSVLICFNFVDVR